MHKWVKLTLITCLVFLILSLSFFIFFIKIYKSHYVVPILMYHYLNPNPDPEDRLTVSPSSFERQVWFLKTFHYNVIPLEELADLIREKKKIPPRTIAITLDDGAKDNFTYVFPILKKYNLPATMFIIINEVGRKQNDRLSWDEIKIMQDSGLVAFGSHTLGPEPLVNIVSEKEIRRQIFDSKKILEEKLGVKVNMFSYPEGFFNSNIKHLLIEAGYKLAVATMPGKAYPSEDVFILKRLRISENSSNLLVFWFTTSGIYTFIRELDKDN